MSEVTPDVEMQVIQPPPHICFDFQWYQDSRMKMMSFMETINNSIKPYMEDRVYKLIPNIILDDRTTLQTCVRLLKGKDQTITVKHDDGTEGSGNFHPTYNNIFSYKGDHLLSRTILQGLPLKYWKCIPLLSNLRYLKLPMGNYVLVFTPGASLWQRIDGKTKVLHGPCELYLRRRYEEDVMDFGRCTQDKADLKIEWVNICDVEGGNPPIKIPSYSHSLALQLTISSRSYIAFMTPNQFDIICKIPGFKNGMKGLEIHFLILAPAIMRAFVNE